MKKQTISVFSLVMMNIIAIDSIRTLPISAAYGLSAVFFYLLAALLFFLPSALVCAELATGWPENGGLYVWVREALGKHFGFATIWLSWFYNLCWYPTILSLIASTLVYWLSPELIQSKIYMLSMVMILYWSMTLLNCLDITRLSRLSSLFAIVGTLIPMLLIISFGLFWQLSAKPLQIDFSWQNFFPSNTNFKNIVFFTAILYGFVGIEMTAVYAGDVNNPQKNYPKAVFWSTLIIVFTLIFGSVAISLVVPTNQLNIMTGFLQAFDTFFTLLGIQALLPFLVAAIVVGSLGGVAAWMRGPAKGLSIAAKDLKLPCWISQTNKNDAPIAMLIIQGIFFTLLCSVFLLMPSVKSSFWILTDITAILSLAVYVMLFISVLVLRYKRPKVKRTFMIPGGQIGLWLTALCGLSICFVVIGIGFIPPSSINVGTIFNYEMILVTGVFIGCVLPFILLKLWQKKLTEFKP